MQYAINKCFILQSLDFNVDIGELTMGWGLGKWNRLFFSGKLAFC